MVSVVIHTRCMRWDEMGWTALVTQYISLGRSHIELRAHPIPSNPSVCVNAP